MYRLKESGVGKKFNDKNGSIFLTENLTQKELKYLFEANSEFVEYEQDTEQGKRKPKKAKSKKREVPAKEKENTSVNDNDNGRETDEGERTEVE